MDAAGFFRVLIGTKSLFCFRSILHVSLKVMPHTAHRSSLLSAARSSIRRRLARSSTVHVESSDTMRSRKAQCQAPPDNPETGDTYHSRERRSCAGEKLEHQNEYNKRHSSSSAGMHVYKRGGFQQTRNLWRKRASMGYRVRRVSPRAASSWSRWQDGCGFRGVFWVGRIFDEARPTERSERGRFLPIGKKASSYQGAYRVPLFN